MRLGCYLGKPNQLRALKPVAHAARLRGWDLTWDGPGQWRPSAVHQVRQLPDVMVSLDPPKAPCPWIWLQAGMDPFHDPLLPGTEAVVAIYTDWWRVHLPRGVRGITTGMPLLGQRIEGGERPLVYVPFSVRSGSPTWLQRAKNTWAHRQFCRALVAWIDRQQAGIPLHVKTRAKDPIPPYLRASADRVLTDAEGDTLEWLARAWACVHVYSSVVLEAAALGVPSLCADPGPAAFGPRAARFCHGRLGGLFHWPGVVEHVPMAEAFATHPRFRIDPEALRRYRETYVGDTARAADNVLDLAERMK